MASREAIGGVRVSIAIVLLVQDFGRQNGEFLPRSEVDPCSAPLCPRPRIRIAPFAADRNLSSRQALRRSTMDTHVTVNMPPTAIGHQRPSKEEAVMSRLRTKTLSALG